MPPNEGMQIIPARDVIIDVEIQRGEFRPKRHHMAMLWIQIIEGGTITVISVFTKSAKNKFKPKVVVKCTILLFLTYF